MTGAPDDVQLSKYPGWVPAVLIDAATAAGAYYASYWLRFSGEEFQHFVPGLRATVGLVVACQLASLALARTYGLKRSGLWPFRVLGGVAAGTGAAMAFVWATRGFAGLSRSVFGGDAILFSLAALGWRSTWTLAARSRKRLEPAGADQLIDRNQELTTLAEVVASLYGYRELLKNLVLKDLKLKYRGSVFGFLWSLANPLLMILVYTIAFTYILQFRTERFVFYLMLGLQSWAFFANSASMATSAVVANSGLLKSVSFPRAVLPIATVLFNLAQYFLTIVVFLPVMLLWYGEPLSGPMLLYPVFLWLQVVFTIGIALLLATSTVFFRDVTHLLEIALSMMFWTTPIVYELRQVPEELRLLVLMSPASPFVVGHQQIFYYGEWPEPAIWLMASVYALVSFIVGATLFLSFEDGFAERL